MKILPLLLVVACLALAQSPRVSVGSGSPPAGTCANQADAGAFYVQSGNSSTGTNGLFVCVQTGGAGTLGASSFAWSTAGAGAAGGDLSGVFPNPTVAKLNGVAASSYAQAGSVPWVVTTTSGSGTAYAGTPTLMDGTAIPAALLAAPRAGQVLILIPDIPSTGTAATLSIDGSTTKNIKKGMTLNSGGDLNSTTDLLTGRGVTLVLNSTLASWLLQGIGKYTSTGGTITVTQNGNIYNFEIATPNLTGTTTAIGGGALAAGACTTGTVAVTNSTTAMSVIATPVSDPQVDSTHAVYWTAWVSTAGTVTVRVCAVLATTPAAVAYNVRVLQ